MRDRADSVHGVHHDELHPAHHRWVELPRRILADELLRDHGVGADEEPDVGLFRGFRPPNHRPCTASAIMIPGWSIVAAEKNIVDPARETSPLPCPPSSDTLCSTFPCT